MSTRVIHDSVSSINGTIKQLTRGVDHEIYEHVNSFNKIYSVLIENDVGHDLAIITNSDLSAEGFKVGQEVHATYRILFRSVRGEKELISLEGTIKLETGLRMNS